MIDKNADAYAHRKPDDINITDKEWEAASDKTRLLLIYTQQMVRYLGEAYMEEEKQGNQEQAALLYQILRNRPCLLSIDPNINDFRECIEREAKFTASTRSWIQEIKKLLYQDFLKN